MPKDRTRPELAPLVRSVVHPTDFSPASERAFACALAIAVLRQTTLTLLHIEKGKSDWSKFPGVRKTLERWGLLKPGSAQADVFADLFPAAPAVPSDGLPLAAGGLVDTVTGPVQAALDAANRGDVARTAGSTRRRSDHRWIRA